MEYDGLFDFQLCLYKMFGKPVNGDPKIVQLPSEKVAEFCSSVKRVGSNVCFDVGGAASQSIDEVLSHESRVLMLGRRGADYLESVFVPDGVQVIIDKDPRESYALVHCRPSSNEYRIGMKERAVRGSNDITIYPNGSSLMARTASSAVPFQNFFCDDLMDMVFARVMSKVVPGLRRYYCHAKISKDDDVSMDAVAPVEWRAEEYVTGTNFGSVSFCVERSHGMKNKKLEAGIKMFFGKDLPFPVYVWCMAVPNRARLVDVSVLVEIP
ncbi:MAG TPA: hypothetical protein VI612_01200 [Candidatus Nanoarchaeia archaeon]|nr:hypothetical protein [Candidatus Nanoarchaeia archaeon]